MKLVIVLLGLTPLFSSPLLAAEGWKERTLSTFEFLREGHFPDAGANLFVSRDGVLGPIHSWDLNDDGYAEIVFNNSHDHAFEIPATVFLNPREEATRKADALLPAKGGADIAAADLNKDGWTDLVVANGNNNTTGYQASTIYWGNKEGWSAERKTELMSYNANRVVLEDVNGDGFAEVIFANRGDKPGVDQWSLVYWNDGEEFRQERVMRYRTAHARAAVVGDFDGDGLVELAFGVMGNDEEKGGVAIFKGTEKGPRTYAPARLNREKVMDLVWADVDGDGIKDLLVASGGEGDKAGSGFYRGAKEGFSEEAFVMLPVESATAVAVGRFDGGAKVQIAVASYKPSLEQKGKVTIFEQGEEAQWKAVKTIEVQRPMSLSIGDVNGDEVDDLLVMEHWNRNSKSIDSRIFLGGENGLDQERSWRFPTHGGAGGKIVDVNKDGQADVLLANSSTGRTYGDIDSYVYWGGREKGYSPGNRTDLPTLGGYASVIADFNGDGISDLLLVTSGEDDHHDFLKKGSYIYWGGKEGLSVERRLELPKGARGFGATTADLNRDGYLDLVFGDRYGGHVLIYYGSEKGYEEKNLKRLNARKPMFMRVVDVDGDGWLDVVAPMIAENMIRIYRNSPDGFHDDDLWEIPFPGPTEAEFADLNKDGWLDMIVTSFYEPTTTDHRSTSAIYWGGPEGYTVYHRTLLLTSGAVDASVADFNRDGHLDIVFSCYHGNSTRAIPSYVYWGDGNDFSDNRRTELETLSASGNLVLDLNEDGWPDIVFSNHNRNNDHHNDSMIYWGSKEGFNRNNVTWLPAIGPHQMGDADAGNLLTRALKEEYLSPVIEVASGTERLRWRWLAREPRGAGVKVLTRRAGDRDALQKVQWTEAKNGEPLDWKEPEGGVAQFKVEFESKTGASQARLEWLKLDHQ